MEYDLKIRGATLYDGSGAEGFRGDLAIRDGRIAALGAAPGDARETLDADGLALAPGFVDIHTHYDAQVLWDRLLSVSPAHGVTTAVIGNCGFGVAPTRAAQRERILRTLEKVEGMSFEALEAGLGSDWGFESFPEYLDRVEARGSAINLAALIGHTPLRLFVMGDEATQRSATPEEIETMRALVGEALAAGALGFATSKAPTHVGYGGRPVPSRLAEFDEIRTLAGELRHAGRGVLQATAGVGLFLDELGVLARETGRNVSWTALLAGSLGPGGHRRILERTAADQAQGLRVIPQVSCRPLCFEFQWSEPFPFESLELFKPVSAADRAGQRAIYADPDFRARLREDSDAGFGQLLKRWWERTVIASCPGEPGLDERPLAALARERGQHPVDAALDIALASDLAARFRLAIMNTDENDVAELLNDPHTVLGLSDAGAHASQLCDAGFSTHLLGHWVRERGALTLPQAIRMLTSRPAEVFGIEDRGLLAGGRPADLVLFDPLRVAAGPLRRVRDLPGGADRLVSDSIGVEAVFVNGAPLLRGGRYCVDADGALPGRLLRGGRAA